MNDTPHPDRAARLGFAFDDWQAALHHLRRARLSLWSSSCLVPDQTDQISRAIRAERTARGLYFSLSQTAYGAYPVPKDWERAIIGLAPP